MRFTVPVLAALGAVLGACAGPPPPPAELAFMPTVELCARRGSVLTAPAIRRELALRGEDCAAIDQALMAQAPPLLGPGAMPPAPPFGLQAPPFMGSLPPPVPRGRAWAYGAPETYPRPYPLPYSQPDNPRPDFLPEQPEVAEGGGILSEPLPEPPAQQATVQAQAAPEPGRPATPPQQLAAVDTTAPAISPACAERIVMSGPPAGGGPNARAVAFRNRCDDPIRVRYAEQPNGEFSEVTRLLQPGETSAPARIADNFDQPAYVVCGYASLPESAACR